eukprot:1609761-Prymnesium_polylepis.1
MGCEVRCSCRSCPSVSVPVAPCGCAPPPRRPRPASVLRNDFPCEMRFPRHRIGVVNARANE